MKYETVFTLNDELGRVFRTQEPSLYVFLTSGFMLGIFSVTTMENSAGKKLQLVKISDDGKLRAFGGPESFSPLEPWD